MLSLLIVVPCYNEARRLDLEQIRNFSSDAMNVTFVFVDDGSTDSTLELLETLHRENPERYRVIPLSDNHGKAEAVRIGIIDSLDGKLSLDFISYFDADFSTALAELGQMAVFLSENPKLEAAFGSRHHMKNSRLKRNVLRHGLGRFYSFLIRKVLGVSICDLQCGAKVFRNNEVFRKVFSASFLVNWLFDSEIVLRYHLQLGSIGNEMVETIAEYPLREWIDKDGSKLSLKGYLASVMDLIKLALIRRVPFSRASYRKKVF